VKRRYKYWNNLPHFSKRDRFHFVTFCTQERFVLLPAARDLVLDHCLFEHDKRIEMSAVVIMPDHVHLLFTPRMANQEEWYSLSEIMNGIKGTSAHSVNKLLHRSGKLWQQESFDHIVRTTVKLDEVVEYIRMNPVRAGLVSKPETYPWLWTKTKLVEE
jgi:REP element-mobilizing transposase RayT